MEGKAEIVAFGGGCFWCTEAVFLQLKGVTSVVSGYAGGHVKDPTYDQVSMGATGHAEVIRVLYDPSVIPFKKLLEIFFVSHDPTSANRQGNDVGEQYRSIILYTTEEQKQKAEQYITELESAKKFPQPVVTQLALLDAFYPAEEYHKNYYERNQSVPYSQIVIAPKVEKVRREYKDIIK